MMYLPGITFLFLASAVIAIPFAMGGFDLGFLMIQIIIGLCAAVVVNFGVEQIRKRSVRTTQGSN